MFNTPLFCVLCCIGREFLAFSFSNLPTDNFVCSVNLFLFFSWGLSWLYYFPFAISEVNSFTAK